MSGLGLSEGEWVTGLLLFARVAPTLLMLAALSRGLVSWPVALSLAAALTAGLLPVSIAVPALLLPSVLRELTVGLAFALLSALPLLVVLWAVRPLEQALWGLSGPPLSRLYVLCAAVLVLSLGGHRAWVSALSLSLRDLPLGAALGSAETLLSLLLSLLGDGLRAALGLGLPLWMSVWLLDLTLALMVRLHDANESVSRLPVRAALSLLLVSLLLAPVVSHAPALVRDGLVRARGALPKLAP